MVAGGYPALGGLEFLLMTSLLNIENRGGPRAHPCMTPEVVCMHPWGLIKEEWTQKPYDVRTQMWIWGQSWDLNSGSLDYQLRALPSELSIIKFMVNTP